MPMRDLGSQTLKFHAIGNTLGLCQDPDWAVWTAAETRNFIDGVGIGVRAPLPRMPAVYERKQDWRSYEDSLETSMPHSRDNYPSIQPNLEMIEQQFLEEAEEDLMVELPEDEVRSEFPETELNIAALAAVRKTDDSFRVLHDGTHGVIVNPRIIMRDQMRCPGVPEQRQVMRYARDRGSAVFAIKGDIKKAHRRVLIHRRDWGYQACRLRPNKIWLNKVGTFGIGSAAYWWSRMCGGIARLTLYLMLDQPVWQLVFADDLEWVVQGPHMFDNLVLMILFQVMMGVPYAWQKFAGGTELEWVGYYLDYKAFTIGISEARAKWLADWLRDTHAAGGVRVQEFEEVLGRLGFAANALWHIRPWLGPMYAWASATPSGCFLALPILMRLIFMMLMSTFSKGKALAPLKDIEENDRSIFWADAMASDQRVGIGGWEERPGRAQVDSPWFAEVITEEQAPWLYDQGESETFRKIAALELIASIACVRLFGNEDRHNGSLLKMVGRTDNKGNSHVVAKLLTTKFPLCAVLMQLTSDLGTRGVDLDLAWIPREENILADELSNGTINQRVDRVSIGLTGGTHRGL